MTKEVTTSTQERKAWPLLLTFKVTEMIWYPGAGVYAQQNVFSVSLLHLVAHTRGLARTFLPLRSPYQIR